MLRDGFLQPSPKGPLALLIVEDSPEQRSVYRRYLSRQTAWPVQLHEAETGEEGLEVLQTTALDAVVLDFLLPDMDGIEFLDALAKSGTASTPPVVMLTSQGSEAVAVAAMKRGASDYITKQHLSPDLLVLTIEQAIERKQQAQFLRLLESAPDAMVVSSAEGTIVFANAKAESLFGVQREDLFQQRLDAIIEAPEPSKQHGTGPQLWKGPPRADGRAMWLEVSESPLYLGEEPLTSRTLRDVTERVEAERAIRISEERYRTLTTSAPDAIITVNAQAVILDWNAAATRIFGHSHDAMIGAVLHQVIPALQGETPEVPVSLARMYESLADGHVKEMEGVDAEGRRFPIELALSQWQTGDDRFYTAIVRDVTARKEAQQALERSESHIRAMLDAIPDAMVRLDRGGHYLDVHLPPQYTPIAAPEAVIGKHYSEVLPDHLHPVVHKVLEAVFATGDMQQFEYTTHVSGQERIREARIAQCGPDEAISIQRDITLRKTAERALQKSEALLRAIVENIPVILFAVDRKRHLTLLEGKGLEALQVKPSQGVGYPARRVFARLPGILDAIEQTFDRVPQPHSVAVDSYAFDCVYAPLLSAADDVIGVIGVAVNVTERVASQQALAESQKALRELAAHIQSVREKERTRLSREVHDVLGQAMTALKMDVVWLEHESDTLPSAAVSRLDDMKAQIDETIHVVRRIASDLRPGILDDLGVVAAIRWQAERFERRTGITCVVHAPNEDVVLDTERATALFRIFQETLTNVARHAQAHTVTIDFTATASDVTLRVADDGRGITEADLNQRRSLGLLGMHERVVPWNGHIDISGQPDQGTVVAVTLPRQAD